MGDETCARSTVEFAQGSKVLTVLALPPPPLNSLELRAGPHLRPLWPSRLAGVPVLRSLLRCLVQ